MVSIQAWLKETTNMPLPLLHSKPGDVIPGKYRIVAAAHQTNESSVVDEGSVDAFEAL